MRTNSPRDCFCRCKRNVWSLQKMLQAGNCQGNERVEPHVLDANMEEEMHVDRKSLCLLAETEPISFKCVVDEVKRMVKPQSMEWARNLSRF
mmetsp:Transcript_13022/g.24624  ORF Transcript_13022/g.24624 Transcript_13022/m.24624 type:complete len:92 (+) Transcript_13022:91-366(+)